MRVEATVGSVSWIPTDSLRGALLAGMTLKVSHWDQPLPDRIALPGDLEEMAAHDRFRFANVLSVWADVEDGAVVACGHQQASGVVMGHTTVTVAGVGATFRAAGLPTLRPEPTYADGAVRVVQTAGGRTALPIPRAVPHAPFVRWQSPLVWTTLALTLRPDGSSEVELVGASTFPRHWVYDASGAVTLKSGLTDQERWMKHSFGARTPWADRDRAAVVSEVESELEREMSHDIMRGGARPEVRRLDEGTELTRQGDPGDELYLVLDGIVAVVRDGEPLAELGPGAVIGERAILEGGMRTSTVTARTPVRVAVAAADRIDPDRLRELAGSHRREDVALVPDE